LHPLPSGGALADIGAIDFDLEVVAFVGFAANSSRQRLLLLRSGNLEEVLAEGDQFDGRVVAAFRFSLENSCLAVWVLFQDGSTAIYRGNLGDGQSVPEVPAISLGGVVTFLLAIMGLAVKRLRSNS
jgi:hypothetical protein